MKMVLYDSLTKKPMKRTQDRDFTSNNNLTWQKCFPRGQPKKIVPLTEDHGRMQGDPLYTTDYQGTSQLPHAVALLSLYHIIMLCF